MLRSMTGYGGSERADGNRSVRVEARSVNQRFLDVQVKAPRQLLPVEDRIRKAVESRLARGKVTIYIDWRETGEAPVALNADAARALVRDLRELGRELSIEGDVDMATLAALPQLFEPRAESSDADELWNHLEPPLSEAIAALVAMRETEGAELESELARRLDAIDSIVSTVERKAPEATLALKERVEAKMRELLEGVATVDEGRIAQEAASAAERADFTEELVRLRAHVSQAREVLGRDEPTGKRLNFLAQEMHREANTMGSKTTDTDLSVSAVELKEEIEKFREQIQNVE
ncbi:MAG: YicC family protein [Candidatus Eisenbacteria bacterium]|nr:YicC family protein [Candidatus Eisenbacteria bacterium]